MKLLKLVLAASLALFARGVVAQTSTAPVEPIPPATAPAAPVPTLSQTAAPSPQAVPVSPAPQAATAAPATDKVTSDFSGWLILQSFYDQGGLNAMDLPKNATTAGYGANAAATEASKYADESATGMMIRQSRFRWNLGLPTDGFLSGAALKGLAEFDFAGSQGADISSWMPRIRHAFVSATWKDLNNLQVLVGQTWGVVPGPYFAESITHVIMPRFGGAGFLFRRAPQVRLSGNLPLAAGAGVTYTAAALTPDVAEGQRSGMPHLEGRISANYKQEGKQLADVGFFAHMGKKLYETYDVTATTKTYDATKLDTQVLGVDAKISVPYVSLVGAYFAGKNIDTTYNSIAPGVATTSVPDPTVLTNPPKILTKVEDVKTQGFFGQATVTPIKGVALVLGYGQEKPDVDSYKAGTNLAPTATAPQIAKNAQLSGGVILNVTSKWRVGLEYTQFSTEYTYGSANPNKTFDSKQVELGTLFAF